MIERDVRVPPLDASPNGSRVSGDPGERHEAAAAPKPEPETEAPKPDAVAELRKNPAFYNADHRDHGKVMQQYRAAMFAQMTPEEKKALADAPDADIFSRYGVKDPSKTAKDWNAAPAVIKEVNDYAVGRVIALGGEKFSDAEAESFIHRFKGKVPENTLKRLVRWAREEATRSPRRRSACWSSQAGRRGAPWLLRSAVVC